MKISVRLGNIGNWGIIMVRIISHSSALCGAIPTFSIDIITTIMFMLSNSTIFFILDTKTTKLDKMTGFSTIVTVQFFVTSVEIYTPSSTSTASVMATNGDSFPASSTKIWYVTLISSVTLL